MVGMMAWLLVFVGAQEAQGGEPERGQEPSQWSLRARLGVEYDDNPLRQESYSDVGDGLSRYLVGMDILTDLVGRGQVSVSLRQGGEYFFRFEEARTMLSEGRGVASMRLPGALRLELRGDVRDRYEETSVRDYVRGGASLRLWRGSGPVQLGVDGGMRFFAFKPTATSSNTGPRVQAMATVELGERLRVDVGGGWVWRNYRSEAWVLEEGRIVRDSEGALRADRFDTLAVGGRYQGGFAASLGYRYARNQSNSYGQELQRHGVVASATVPLWWEMYWSGRVEVQRTRYEDPVLLDEIFYLDEENRNSFGTALARRVGSKLELEVRYSVFLQEFGLDGSYQRQVLGVSLIVEADGF